MEDCRLILGRCEEVLPTLEAGSIDFVFTDPPYPEGADMATGDGTVWPELVRRLREEHVGPRPLVNSGPLGDPADVHLDVPALIRQLREAEAGMRVQPAPSGYRALEAKLDALMALLSLSARERAFVNHLAEHPSDRPTLLVFRDWLREQRRDAEADAFEELAGEGKGA